MKKTYTIKKYNGQKTMIVNSTSDVTKELFKMAENMGIDFAVKAEIGICIYGTFSVAEMLGISDVSTLISFVNA